MKLAPDDKKEEIKAAMQKLKRLLYLAQYIVDGVTLECFHAEELDVVIPTIESRPILYIGSAFIDSNISSIVIPASVKAICGVDDYGGVGAFKGCSNLTSVTFEAGSALEHIECNAFKNSAIKSIVIPASVKEIGHEAFKGCSNLTSVTFEAGSQLKSIGKSTFHTCHSLKEIHIPHSVQSIVENGITAFWGMTKKQIVYLPKHLVKQYKKAELGNLAKVKKI